MRRLRLSLILLALFLPAAAAGAATPTASLSSAPPFAGQRAARLSHAAPAAAPRGALPRTGGQPGLQFALGIGLLLTGLGGARALATPRRLPR